MRRVRFTPCTLCAVMIALLLVGPPPVAQAQFQYTGDITGTDGDNAQTGLTYDWYYGFQENPDTWHFDPGDWQSIHQSMGVFGYYGKPGTLWVNSGQSLFSAGLFLGWGSASYSYSWQAGTYPGGYTPGGTTYSAPGGSGTVYVSGSGATLNCRFTWDGYQYGTLICGNDAATSGTVAISAGGAVTANTLFLGRSGTGTLTVSGAGSSMTAYGAGYIGDQYSNGRGTVTVSNGGVCNFNGGACYVAGGSGATGNIKVDGAGSALNEPTLPDYPTYCPFWLGGNGNGTLVVSNGATATVGDLWVGAADNASGGAGTLKITGANSTVTANSPGGYFKVGGVGQTGIVNITNGGKLDLSWGDNLLGCGGSAAVNVDGAGSQWNCYASGPANQFLQIGNNGGSGGTLNISGGGHVYVAGTPTGGVPGVFLYDNNALVSIDVGRGSSLSGSTFNGLGVKGKVRVVSAADVASGNYTPITMSSWTGYYSPTFQGVGGAWNSSTHQFTVSSAVAGTAGTPVSITPSGTNQRVLISDNAAGTALGIGFLSSEGFLTVTGTTLTGAPLSALASLLPTGNSVLDGWALTASGGYTAGDPAYLSLSLESPYSAYTRDDLSVWGYNGTAWSQLAANDLTFDGSYASFTAMALNGYDYAIIGTSIVVHHPGDANGDGKVDINDLNVVLGNYDKSTAMTWATGDFNGDGKVDINDLNTVLSNYDKTYASAPASVPEPSGIVMLLGLAAMALLCWLRT